MKISTYINLPIKDIEQTEEFFSALGFDFNPEFSDDDALCMVVEENIYVMFIIERRFKDFTKKNIADAKKVTECINTFTVDTKEKVDEFMENVLDAGGKETRKPEDHGWMYGRSFEDPNGHIWEIFYIDSSKKEES